MTPGQSWLIEWICVDLHLSHENEPSSCCEHNSRTENWPKCKIRANLKEKHIDWLIVSLSTQGYLIANHLPKEDLLDICLYCQHYCLLCLGAEQRVGQLVVWREVFLQRHSHTSTSHPGYCESHGRFFLLVVGLVRVFFYFLSILISLNT